MAIVSWLNVNPKSGTGSKEVKGDQLKLTVDGQIDINATLHAEQMKEL